MQPYQKEVVIPFAKLIHKAAPHLSISILEIGARPIPDAEEPYPPILDIFENARIHAFEIDEDLCNELNSTCHEKIRYYPRALSDHNGKQTLYETENSACSSLYKADGELMEKYFQLEMAMPKAEHEIPVSTLDTFMEEEGINDIDVIKIDIQGAELDVFKGGTKAVSDSIFIISEVEFIPLYENQPLFGDVCKHLHDRDFMFHKLIAPSGRCLKPVAIHNNELYASQIMWADAVFIRHIKTLDKLSDDALYKTALFSFIYGSPDLTVFCMQILDKRNQSDLCTQFANLAQQLQR